MYFFVQNHDKKVKCSENYLTHSYLLTSDPYCWHHHWACVVRMQTWVDWSRATGVSWVPVGVGVS